MAPPSQEREPQEGEIRLWRENDWWVAEHSETGVTTQGPSRDAALDNLDEAVTLHRGDVGDEPTADELREVGVEPADNTTGDEEPPDVLR